ncbi:YraN family protein [Patescibacteria group bacterium]|nr:YraN family protein [Patescibacteria group bacterium]
MKQANFEKGRLGEEIACRLLKEKGYLIVETNFRTRFGELDIIASKGNFLVFVEVKLKKGTDFGLPEEMITEAKLLQVRRTAEAYLQQNPSISVKFLQYRIDAVCIVLNENNTLKEARHYENVMD